VVEVTGVTNGTEATPQQVMVTIIDDDPPPEELAAARQTGPRAAPGAFVAREIALQR
jgi:hypothetical protein